MKKYKVISLTVGGLGNKIFHSGDTVTESNFPQGNAIKLEEQGFIKEIVEEKTKKVEVKTELDEVAPEGDESAPEGNETGKKKPKKK